MLETVRTFQSKSESPAGIVFLDRKHPFMPKNMARAKKKSGAATRGEIVNMKELITSLFSLVVLVLIVLLSPASGWGSDEYVLVMSKNDELCRHMLKIYNDDLEKYGNVMYNEHKEFNLIKWKNSRYFTIYNDTKSYEEMMISKFDVNNDGKEEIVIKTEGYLSSRLTQALHIFKGEDYKYFENDFDMRNINKRSGTIGVFERMEYPLKEIPSKEPIPPGGYNSGYDYWDYYSIGPQYFINTLIYKNKYFIDIRDPDGYPWVAILEFTKGNALNDICYFFKSLDCKKTTKRRKL